MLSPCSLDPEERQMNGCIDPVSQLLHIGSGPEVLSLGSDFFGNKEWTEEKRTE
jgi:hypothetical protein